MLHAPYQWFTVLTLSIILSDVSFDVKCKLNDITHFTMWNLYSTKKKQTNYNKCTTACSIWIIKCSFPNRNGLLWDLLNVAVLLLKKQYGVEFWCLGQCELDTRTPAALQHSETFTVCHSVGADTNKISGESCARLSDVIVKQAEQMASKRGHIHDYLFTWTGILISIVCFYLFTPLL